MEFSGRIAAFPVAELLQWAKNERVTGALVVRRSAREKRIYLQLGDVVGCISSDPAEYYGQHLLLTGHLTQEQLLTALAHCSSRKIRLGAAVLELGMMAAPAVQQTLREQIEDTVCDLFLWERGVFYFQAEMPAEEDILPEPIQMLALVMEGSRWKDEVARMRRVLPHENIVLRRGPASPEGPITVLERKLVRAVDGRRTLGELYDLIRGSYYRFLDAVFRLTVASLLDIEKVGEAAEKTTHEMSVYEVLLEQATEEQAIQGHRQMAIPLELIERAYPVWVSLPSEDEKERMPERARFFYSRLDGNSTLGAVFSTDGRERSREMDLFLLQLEKGRLAILPVPVRQLEVETDRPCRWRQVFTAW